ncbi:MAG: hypothetical protein LBB83_04565 [Treponema sp.]|jgi:hypothetical protein|nr:hypothetical protein [Treponema sp.]
MVYGNKRRYPIGNDHEPPLNNPGHKRITWHTAFCDAIRLELLPYADVLDFDIEHPLTREPLRIDVIIIKKKENVTIDKNIAAIFRGRNIVEYKSPGDSLTIADFHQVMAYAHLYCVPPEKGNMTDLTVTFVTTREPRELKEYLRGVYGYTLTEAWAGITLIIGDVLPMQIIERKKLSPGEGVWLVSLGGDLSVEGIKAVLEKAKKVPRGAPIGAYLYMLLMANAQKTREVLKMSDLATLEEVFEGLPITEYWEARGKAEGKAEGKEEKAIQIARNLKKIGLPPEKIAEATGLTERQINGL